MCQQGIGPRSLVMRRRPAPIASDGLPQPTPTLESVASTALHELRGVRFVQVQIDGDDLWLALEIDPIEHARRLAAGVGAVTSTGDLHGLWLLPAGIPVPACSLPPQKVDRLRLLPQFVEESDAGFDRLFRPAGVVRAVAFTGRRAERVLQRAIRFTPIVERYAVVAAAVSKRAEAIAREWGVGLIEVVAGSSRQILPSSVADRGVPGVYRWWIAELAYRSWRYENTQFAS